jgi:hypothetical protein
VASNEFGHSVTSCFLKLIIPRHFKKPRFLECLRAILSEEGAVNLECKVSAVGWLYWTLPKYLENSFNFSKGPDFVSAHVSSS